MVSDSTSQRDPIRKEARKRIRVKSSVREIVLPCSQEPGADSIARNVLEGEDTFVIYESQLPEILARLEPDVSGVAQAKQHCASDRLRYLQTKVDDAKASGKTVMPEWKDVAHGYPDYAQWVSWPQCFASLHGGRYPLPLHAVEVLEDLPPIPTEMDVSEQKMAALVKAILSGATEKPAVQQQRR